MELIVNTLGKQYRDNVWTKGFLPESCAWHFGAARIQWCWKVKLDEHLGDGHASYRRLGINEMLDNVS